MLSKNLTKVALLSAILGLELGLFVELSLYYFIYPVFQDILYSYNFLIPEVGNGGIALFIFPVLSTWGGVVLGRHIFSQSNKATLKIETISHRVSIFRIMFFGFLGWLVSNPAFLIVCLGGCTDVEDAIWVIFVGNSILSGGVLGYVWKRSVAGVSARELVVKKIRQERIIIGGLLVVVIVGWAILVNF